MSHSHAERREFRAGHFPRNVNARHRWVIPEETQVAETAGEIRRLTVLGVTVVGVYLWSGQRNQPEIYLATKGVCSRMLCR